MFELEQLRQEIEVLNAQLWEQEQQLRAERERQITAAVQAQTANYGFASATAAEDFQRLMVFEIVNRGLPENRSLDGFLQDELRARPPFAGTYRRQGVNTDPLRGVRSPAKESSVDTDMIRPGMSKELFDSTAREIGQLLEQRREELYRGYVRERLL